MRNGRGRRGRKNSGQGLQEGRLDASLGDEEVTLGIEKAGIGVGITLGEDSVEVTLGIGIASVSLDLVELNNSKVSYAFDLYEISGKRDGCTVTLETTMGGQLVHSETRHVPDCKDDKEKTKDEPPERDEDDYSMDEEYDENIDVPGDPFTQYKYLVTANSFYDIVSVDTHGLVRVIIQKGVGQVTGGFNRHSNGKASVASYQIKRKSYYEVYFQPHSYADYILRRPNHPYRKNNVSHAQKMIRDLLLSTGYHLRKETPGIGLIFSAGVFIAYPGQMAVIMSKGKVTSQPGGHYYEGEAFGFSSHHNAKSYAKILDHLPLIPGLPSRGGYNGVRKDRPCKNKKKCMDKECCDLVKKIYKALNCKEMLKEGFVIPKSSYAVDATGQKKLTNYMKVLEYMIRITNHYGIAPISFELADSNLVKEGAQPKPVKTINGTDSIKQVLENTLKNEASNEAILRAMTAMRLSLIQASQIASQARDTSQELAKFVGMPITEETRTFKTPFNISSLYNEKVVKTEKGDKIEEITVSELNTTEKLETLLPKFVKSGEQEYSVYKYNTDFPKLPNMLFNSLGVINNNGSKNQKNKS